MGFGDKIHNAVDKLHGKGKESAGEAIGNDQLKAEGKRNQVKADLKQAGEKVKDAFKKH
ncbi:CsbD family protein [Arthrobacter sp. PsM3]|uniref:CsbD family protein n=1 Tax=Arthrobacter sp. PsM3 TaxID=3030531 RepID=UPI00263B3950|nr:CsbD family protein [Arthrobacter sp. PsM3]MDN4645977.1 CsbD family protein [Arthrobacter sp. PsM3]